jgi:hypothetical protein
MYVRDLPKSLRISATLSIAALAVAALAATSAPHSATAYPPGPSIIAI